MILRAEISNQYLNGESDYVLSSLLFSLISMEVKINFGATKSALNHGVFYSDLLFLFVRVFQEVYFGKLKTSFTLKSPPAFVMVCTKTKIMSLLRTVFFKNFFDARREKEGFLASRGGPATFF